MNLASDLINFRDKLPRIALVVFAINFVTFLVLWLSSSPLPLVVSIQMTRFYIPDALKDFLLLFNIAFLSLVSVRFLDWLSLYRKRRTSKYVFKPHDWPRGWVFSGKPEVKSNELHVKSSRAGLLLEEVLWRNFRMAFKMKFDEKLYGEPRVGLIFRARDLDNYLVLEIRGDEGSVAPHIRFKSGWQTPGVTGVTKISKFKFNQFRELKLEAKGEVVSLFYEGNEEPVCTWNIPTHVDINHFEAGVKEEEKEKVSSTMKDISGRHVVPIPFRLDHEMVGFRVHHGNQGAVIKDLTVQAL